MRIPALLSLVSMAAVTTAVAPSAAVAQAPAASSFDPAKMVGTKVVDAKDGDVGTVIGFKDGILIVKTDRNEASLPPASFTYQNGKLYFGMTRDQLNAAVEKASAEQKAAIAASLAPGATVKGKAGNDIGTIESIDSEFATIALNDGRKVKIPRSGIAGTPNGAIIGMTAEELEAAVQAGGQH